MSAPISDVVQVTVTTQSAAVQQQGFGKGLVLATHLHFSGRTKEYGAASQMAADGFATTEAAYLAVVEYFSQNPAPKTVKVGRRHADAGTVVVNTAVDTTNYTLTIQGVAYIFGSGSGASTSSIATGLRAAINADSACPVAATGSGANIILTTKVSGTGWSLAITGTRMSLNALTAAETIGAALDATVLLDTDFYGVVLCDRASADMQAGATWVSANSRVLFASTSEANVVGQDAVTDTATLPALMKNAGYDRVITFYDPNAATSFIDAAAMGRALAFLPGGYTLDFKDLQGVAVSNLTPTQRANALSKNCNVYEARGGLNQANDGRMASGKFIDQIHGRDWLSSTIATNIFAAISALPKVPYTDAGIGVIEAATKQAGAQGVARNYLASYSTSFPKAADASSVNKAARIYAGATMTAQEAGAIHSVQFQITVQV